MIEHIFDYTSSGDRSVLVDCWQAMQTKYFEITELSITFEEIVEDRDEVAERIPCPDHTLLWTRRRMSVIDWFLLTSIIQPGSDYDGKYWTWLQDYFARLPNYFDYLSDAADHLTKQRTSDNPIPQLGHALEVFRKDEAALKCILTLFSKLATSISISFRASGYWYDLYDESEYRYIEDLMVESVSYDLSTPLSQDPI